MATLNGRLSDRVVVEEAARLGVEVGALSSYAITRSRRNGIVFGFGSVRPAAMRTGTQRLARAIAASRAR